MAPLLGRETDAGERPIDRRGIQRRIRQRFALQFEEGRVHSDRLDGGAEQLRAEMDVDLGPTAGRLRLGRIPVKPVVHVTVETLAVFFQGGSQFEGGDEFFSLQRLSALKLPGAERPIHFGPRSPSDGHRASDLVYGSMDIRCLARGGGRDEQRDVDDVGAFIIARVFHRHAPDSHHVGVVVVVVISNFGETEFVRVDAGIEGLFSEGQQIAVGFHPDGGSLRSALEACGGAFRKRRDYVGRLGKSQAEEEEEE